MYGRKSGDKRYGATEEWEEQSMAKKEFDRRVRGKVIPVSGKCIQLLLNN